MFITVIVSMMLLQTPDSVLSRIGIDQRLGESVDPKIAFRDETGRPVQLADFFGKKPIVLTPVYFECPMLCGMQLNGLVRALKVMPFTAGEEFEIVTFSFDPNEDADLARSKKEHYVRDYGRPRAADGWHFLTGDEEAIRDLTASIGFRYTFDENVGQWAHASTLVVLTPAGRISQYLNGIEYDPAALKYSVIEASEYRLGSVVDRVLLLCYQYDPHSGKYSLAIMRVVRLAGAATVLAIIGFWRVSRRALPDCRRGL